MIVRLFSSFDPLNILPLNSIILVIIFRSILLSCTHTVVSLADAVYLKISHVLFIDYDVNAPKSSNLFVAFFPVLCIQLGLINFIGLGASVFTAASRLSFTLSLSAVL